MFSDYVAVLWFRLYVSVVCGCLWVCVCGCVMFLLSFMVMFMCMCVYVYVCVDVYDYVHGLCLVVSVHVYVWCSVYVVV